jgi:type I restriction enzyme M protein
VVTIPAKYEASESLFSRVIESVRGHLDSSEFGLVALTLVFLRATREVEWPRLLAASPREAAFMLDRLGREPELPAEGDIRAIRDLFPGTALTDTLKAIDRVASRFGNNDTFQLLLDEFASDAKATGGVYTPKAVTAALARMLDAGSAPTVYDPFCRAGELLVAVASDVRANLPHAPLYVYGNMPSLGFLDIARMNILLHKVDGELGTHDFVGQEALSGETLRFPRIISNPPFNLSKWDRGSHRSWRYGQPPPHNANFAWLQDAVERLMPGGRAGLIMANSAASTTNRTEKEIRMRMVEDGCVEALISLPPALFRGTGVPAMIWLLTPSGTQRKEILFIDASAAGRMVSRVLRKLEDSEVQEIVQIIENWRAGYPVAENEGTISGGSISLQKIRALDYDLNPASALRPPYAAPRVEDALPEIRELASRLGVAQAISDDRHSAVTRVMQDPAALNELLSAASGDWPTVPLADLCDLVPGTPTRDAPDGSVPVLKPKNVNLGRLGGLTDMLSVKEVERLTRYQVKSGDLLCTRTGTVGKVALASKEQDGWIFGTGLIRIRAKPQSLVDPLFLNFYFTHPAIVDWIQRNAGGTSIPNISSKVLGTLPVWLPSLSDQRAIGAALNELNESIQAHQWVIETTAELRTALLPLLMSRERPT